jgi:hypothetical protein
MFYLTFYFFLASLFGITKKIENKHVFLLFFLIFTIFSAFRYGRGADYFIYSFYYNRLPNSIEKLNFLTFGFEPGYTILALIFKNRQATFATFIVFYTLINFFLLFSIIKKYSHNAIFSLFILYANYYLTYLQNALRQSMAMSIVLFALVNYLNNRKVNYYLLTIAIAGLFHISSLFFIIIPIALKIFTYKHTSNIFFCMFLILVSCILSVLILRVGISLVGMLIPKISYYLQNDQTILIPLFPLGVRILLFLMVFRNIKNRNYVSDFDKGLYSLYILGLVFFCLFNQISIFSRISDYLSMLEIILVPNLLFCKRSYKQERSLFLCLFIFVYGILFYKDCVDCQKTIGKSGNPMDYSYVSIFNKAKVNNVMKKRVDIIRNEWDN